MTTHYGTLLIRLNHLTIQSVSLTSQLIRNGVEMKEYKTLFVTRFNGFKMVQEPVTVQAKDIQQARQYFAQMSRELRQAWITKKVTLA
jgi:hypothetical protein